MTGRNIRRNSNMFIGHLGVGMALKRVEPKANLGLLFLGSLFLDFMLGIFVLVGLEDVRVPADYAQKHYLTFTFPYSHGLVAAITYSVLAFAIICGAGFRDKVYKIRAALAVGLVVLIHWVCDWLEHPGLLPLAGEGSYHLGLGLWDKLVLALGIEVILVVLGLVLYLRQAREIGRWARWGFSFFMIILTFFAVAGQATATSAPSDIGMAVIWILSPIVLSLLAFWVDRKRQPVAFDPKSVSD